MHLWLTDDLVKRGAAACDRLPGLSVSSIVDQYLRQMVPTLERVADAVEAGDVKAVRQAFELAIGGAMWDALGPSRDAGGDT